MNVNFVNIETEEESLNITNINPNSEKLTALAKPLKILMKEFNLVGF